MHSQTHRFTSEEDARAFQWQVMRFVSDMAAARAHDDEACIFVCNSRTARQRAVTIQAPTLIVLDALNKYLARTQVSHALAD